MTPMRDGYVARWRGEEYEVSPDGEEIRLYSTTPRDGFEELRPDRYRRAKARFRHRTWCLTPLPSGLSHRCP